MKKLLFTWLLCTVLGSGSELFPGTGAATLIVTNVYDSGPGSLREAIAQAGAGDEITFDHVLAGTPIIFSRELSIEQDLTITGLGQDLTILDGNAATRVLTVASNAHVRVSGVTIRGGLLVGDPASELPQTLEGAGILNLGTLIMTSVAITSNTLDVGFQYPFPLVMGAGIANKGDLTLNGCRLTNNAITGTPYWNQFGGAVFNDAQARIVDTTIAFNSGGLGRSGRGVQGVAIYNGESGDISLMRCSLNNNGPSSWPAIFNRGLVVVESSTIADNGKGDLAGGGLFNSGVASVVDTVVVGHGLGALADASAINNDRGTLTLLRSTIAHNSAIYAPGIQSSGTLFITNSTIVDNNSSWSTGGIVSSGFTVIDGSTIAGNQSDLALAAGIAGNIEIKNSILVGNYVHGAFGERESNCSAGTQSLGHNLVGISNDCPGLVEGINGDIVGVGLAAVLEIEAQPDCSGCPARPGIANNGGPTPTAALLPGSAALDLVPEDACTELDGKLLATDQRGIPRPQGAGCDAGAFEFIHPQDSVFWMQQCREANSAEYDPAELALFLGIISEKSSAFPECAPANCSALEPDSPRSSWKAKASRELLAVCLNLASGRLTKGRPVDIHGLSSATSVGAAVAEIEATICDPNVSKQQLQRARDIGDRLNQGSY